MFDDIESAADLIDKEISASVKKVLLQRILFKEAVNSDSNNLYLKYKPLNSMYKIGQAINVKGSPQTFPSTPKVSYSLDEIPQPPIVIFPTAMVELQWKDMRRIGPGLVNMGNTCFLNSVVQVLTYTAPLVNYLISEAHKSKCQSTGFCMQCELSNHFSRVLRQNANAGPLRPTSIIENLKFIGKNFKFGRQEDAHEFLRYVVEAIQKSCLAGRHKLDKLSKETTFANAVFGGHFRSQVKCLHCHYESNTFDPMMDINLDIKDCPTLAAALHKSVKPDRLDGANKYFCEKCRAKTVAVKKGTIHQEPNVLTLQLKRFDFSGMFGGKISKEVPFPESLDIRPFMSQSQGCPVLYRLYAVLVHSGYSCNSGHYYCYVKAPNGTWYEMNDAMVRQVGLHTVLSAQAYLLFYIKNEKRVDVCKGTAVKVKQATGTGLSQSGAVSTVTPQRVAPSVLPTAGGKLALLSKFDASSTATSASAGLGRNEDCAVTGVTTDHRMPHLAAGADSSKVQEGSFPRKQPKINWAPGVPIKLKCREIVPNAPSSVPAINSVSSAITSVAPATTSVAPATTSVAPATTSVAPAAASVAPAVASVVAPRQLASAGVKSAAPSPAPENVVAMGICSNVCSAAGVDGSKNLAKVSAPNKAVLNSSTVDKTSALCSLRESYGSSGSGEDSTGDPSDKITPNAAEGFSSSGSECGSSSPRKRHNYHVRLDKWAPQTKALLLPRIVVRSMSDHDADRRNKNLIARASKTSAESSPISPPLFNPLTSVLTARSNGPLPSDGRDVPTSTLYSSATVSVSTHHLSRGPSAPAAEVTIASKADESCVGLLAALPMVLSVLPEKPLCKRLAPAEAVSCEVERTSHRKMKKRKHKSMDEERHLDGSDSLEEASPCKRSMLAAILPDPAESHRGLHGRGVEDADDALLQRSGADEGEREKKKKKKKKKSKHEDSGEEVKRKKKKKHKRKHAAESTSISDSAPQVSPFCDDVKGAADATAPATFGQGPAHNRMHLHSRSAPEAVAMANGWERKRSTAKSDFHDASDVPAMRSERLSQQTAVPARAHILEVSSAKLSHTPRRETSLASTHPSGSPSPSHWSREISPQSPAVRGEVPPQSRPSSLNVSPTLGSRQSSRNCSPTRLGKSNKVSASSREGKLSKLKRSDSVSSSSDSDDGVGFGRPRAGGDTANNTSKRAVPCQVWDAKPVATSSWDGTRRSAVLDHLLSTSDSVRTWDGETRSLPRSLSTSLHDKEQAAGDWDEEYDMGKVKKVRNYEEAPPEKPFWKKNPFQRVQNYRNVKDDSHDKRGPPDRHHSHHHRHQHKSKDRR